MLNISGVWLGNTGRYTLTQDGSRVVWDGIGRYGNKVWHHRGEGMVGGDTIHAVIKEFPDSNFPGHPDGSPVEGAIAIESKSTNRSWRSTIRACSNGPFN